jgi:hypothetical protein
LLRRDLLIAPLGEFCRRRRQITEQTSRSLIGASGEVDLCCRSLIWIGICGADVGWAQRPEAVDGERLAAGIFQRTLKFARSQIIRSNYTTVFRVTTTSELPNEQIVAEASEIKRSQSYTPRRIQKISVIEATQ